MAFFKSSPPPRRNVIPVTVTHSTPGRDRDLDNSFKQIPIQIQQKTAQNVNNSPIPFLPANNGHQNGNNQGKPKIKVTGQALYIGSPRYPNTFYMDVDEDIVDVTKLGCAIQGYGQPEMWTNNKGNGRIEVSYRVGLVGKYKIHITYEGEHIEGSPFNCTLR